MDNGRFQKALKFIYDRQHFGIKLGLDNIRQLAEWLGNPQDRYPNVHVAGTNGKGSTSSFIVSILMSSGYKVGLLTSPHMADFRERIRVNGRKIPKGALVEFVETCRTSIVRSEATFFEVTTALAFWYFARQKVDWAVLETGLGGRLDATNVVIPRVSVITNVSLEHTNLLGKTIYKIAGEKAGIIKPGIPVVTGVLNNNNDVARRLHEVSRERHAPIHFSRRNGYRYRLEKGLDILDIKSGPFAGVRASISLAGRHQADNAYLAVRVGEILKSQGVSINKASLKRGLESNYWPGRFMLVRRKPTVIIDVAHNIDGFQALARTLDDRFAGQKFDFLVGMVEKKQGDRCLEIISPLARSLSLVPLQVERSEDPYLLASRLRLEAGRVRVFPDAFRAAKDLLENSTRSDILIVVGSHFLMGEIASLIRRNGF